ncbi:hypothetical protein [uncultured Deinococcus sp.]|uniref:hypothetical protein n=1 Tax=uncultured Deinococcus sp. TaxID=158789 RepID=UPI0025D068F6|nr:hypothetical protein [uncultured Deinococcus sp.]
MARPARSPKITGQGETWPGLCRELAFRTAHGDDLSKHAFEARTERGLRVYVTDDNAALSRDEEHFGVEVVSTAGDTLLPMVVRHDVLIVERVAAGAGATRICAPTRNWRRSAPRAACSTSRCVTCTPIWAASPWGPGEGA